MYIWPANEGTVFLSSLEQPKLWCLFPRSMNDDLRPTHWGERGHQVPCWNRNKRGFQKIWGNMKQLWKPKTLPYQENGSDFSQEYLLICCRYVLEDGRWGNKIVRSKKRSMKTNDGFIPCILSGRKAMEVKPQSSLWFLESLLQTLHFYIVLLPFSTLTAGMVSLFKVPWSIGCRVSAW